MRMNDIYTTQMGANNTYSTQTRVNDTAICTFSRFNDKRPRMNIKNILHGQYHQFSFAILEWLRMRFSKTILVLILFCPVPFIISQIGYLAHD
jgi:hypothetical protein